MIIHNYRIRSSITYIILYIIALYIYQLTMSNVKVNILNTVLDVFVI